MVKSLLTAVFCVSHVIRLAASPVEVSGKAAETDPAAADLLEKQIGSAIDDKLDNAEVKANIAEADAEAVEDSVQSSLEAAKSGSISPSDGLVEAAAAATDLPVDVAARNATILQAEADVEEARTSLRLAEAQREVTAKQLDEATFNVAKAELDEAKAEQKEEAAAADVHEKIAPKEGFLQKLADVPEKVKEEVLPQAGDSKETETKKELVQAAKDLEKSEEKAGLISKEDYKKDAADLDKQVNDGFAGIYYFVGFVVAASVVGVLWKSSGHLLEKQIERRKTAQAEVASYKDAGYVMSDFSARLS